MENTIHFEQVQVSSYGNIPMTPFFLDLGFLKLLLLLQLVDLFVRFKLLYLCCESSSSIERVGGTQMLKISVSCSGPLLSKVVWGDIVSVKLDSGNMIQDWGSHIFLLLLGPNLLVSDTSIFHML